MSVCPPLMALITSGMMWCDIRHVWLVKPVLQLFTILLPIHWKGGALVTQCVMHARQRCQSWHCTSHRRRHINYLAVATRQSVLVIKVSGWMRSNEFNPLRPILIILCIRYVQKATIVALHMYVYKATYLSYEVSYAKTDFIILFSRERAFFRYKVFSFWTFLCHRLVSVFWKSLIPWMLVQ